jgi:subtilisin family serine protease
MTPRDSAERREIGAGVAVYVFDGGIAADHPELAGRVRIGYDAFPSDPRICNAHGTAVAGAIAGATHGVAPGADVIDVKIINCARDRGSVGAVFDAARWTVEDHRRHPGQPAIANWSFIVDTTRDIRRVDSAIALLRNAGILVIASAGNLDMDACRVSPANSRAALVVGATSLVTMNPATNPDERSEVRTPGTAWGACVNLYAPGESLPLPAIENGRATVATWTGTSMAAGFVSGAAALVLSTHPNLMPDALTRVLLDSARLGNVSAPAAADGVCSDRFLRVSAGW